MTKLAGVPLPELIQARVGDNNYSGQFDPAPVDTMNQKTQTGLSLIELIVAVAILGIVASIAIPSYGNYVKRSKVAEAIAITNEARMALIADHVKRKQFVANHSDISKRNREIGLIDRDYYKSGSVLSMWVGSRGVKGADATSAHIAVMLDPGIDVSSSTSYARLLSTIEYRNGDYIFVCGDTDAVWASNIKHDFLPESCRN
jgi:prepilin-type N-terminal cleavage/methylation domain-containing protein